MSDENTDGTIGKNKGLIALFLYVSGIGGANYFQRSDPFTGKEGDALQAEIHDTKDEVESLEEKFSLFIERGPKDVRTAQEDVLTRLRRIDEKLVVMSTIEIANKSQQDKIEQVVKDIHNEIRDIKRAIK